MIDLAPGARMTATAPSPAPRVGRDGLLRLGFERRGAATVLAGCRSALPLQVLAPVALDDPAAIAFMLNPTGGVLGGDRLAVDVGVGPGAHACLTTPSATRVYRTASEPALQAVTLRVGDGATLEWVPDHTIPFAGSAFGQSIRVEMGEGARLVLIDAFAAGRVERGEAWRFALVDSALTIVDVRGPIFHDRFALRGAPAWQGLGFTEASPYFATVVAVADGDLERFRDEVAGGPGAGGGVRLGVGRLARRGAVVRCLAADAPALAGALEGVWAIARRVLLGTPPLALRKP